jgi:hypothetical protein
VLQRVIPYIEPIGHAVCGVVSAGNTTQISKGKGTGSG